MKYKIGDKVRVAREYMKDPARKFEYGSCWITMQQNKTTCSGTVSNVSCNRVCVNFKRENGTNHNYFMKEYELEPEGYAGGVLSADNKYMFNNKNLLLL